MVENLRTEGYAVVRLPEAEAALMVSMWDAARSFGDAATFCLLDSLGPAALWPRVMVTHSVGTQALPDSQPPTTPRLLLSTCGFA